MSKTTKEGLVEEQIRALVTLRGLAEGPWAPLIGARWHENMGSAVVLMSKQAGQTLKQHLGGALAVSHCRYRGRWRLAVFTERLLAYLESAP